MKRVRIICTGNSCRSQMAEGWLKSFGTDIEVQSAGTSPAPRVSSGAIDVMKEKGIDISGQHPKAVEQFVNKPFDYVITVCDDAKERCPVFTGVVGKRLHIGFEDPMNAVGTRDEVMGAFRTTRDKIRDRFLELYRKELASGS